MVNGIEVDRFDYVPGEPTTSNVDLEVVFDSTHFPNGMQCQVDIFGWSHQGFVYHASGTAPAVNRIVEFNLPVYLWIPGGNGTWQLQQEMAGQNYEFHIVYHNGWSHLDVAASLENAGILYENSHGAPNQFRTDVLDPDQSAAPPPVYTYMYGFYSPEPVLDLCQSRLAWNGSGFPPYNSGGMPPVHFGQMDSCESGGYWADPPPGSNAFATLLYHYADTNWPGVLSPNQAVWTWKGYTQVKCSQNQVWWVYSLMRDGKTARQARDIFVFYNNKPGYQNRRVTISPNNTPGSWVPVTSQEQVPVWGDPYARIKHVYTGDTTIPATEWYW